MSYTRVVNAVFNSPWAIHRPWLGNIYTLLHSRVFTEGSGRNLPVDITPEAMFSAEQYAGPGRSRGGAFSLSRFTRSHGRLVNHSARIHAEAARRCGGDPGTYHNIVREEEAALPAGQILHVFGSGVLGKHLSLMDELCMGGLSVDRVQESLRLGRDDDKVAGIMLHLDTPGGICYGMPETASLVRRIGEEKAVTAFCDSLTASAGYWCAAPSAFFYVTPSADVGSIGVYSALIDYTGWCEKQGIGVELVADGKFKGMGFPGTAYTDEQKEKVRADVMACSKAFKGDVRQARAGISDETLQGQTFAGEQAVEAKLADAVVNDLEEALADFAKTL